MGRLVEPLQATRDRLGPQSPALPPQDGKLERIAKYIPGEVVAGYVSLMSLIEAADPSGTVRVLLSWLVFGVGVGLTPFYLSRFARPGQPKRLHMGVSTLAFVVWAYALGGPFRFVGWHDPLVAAVGLGLWTWVSGAFAPAPGDR